MLQQKCTFLPPFLFPLKTFRKLLNYKTTQSNFRICLWCPCLFTTRFQIVLFAEKLWKNLIGRKPLMTTSSGREGAHPKTLDEQGQSLQRYKKKILFRADNPCVLILDLSLETIICWCSIHIWRAKLQSPYGLFFAFYSFFVADVQNIVLQIETIFHPWTKWAKRLILGD